VEELSPCHTLIVPGMTGANKFAWINRASFDVLFFDDQPINVPQWRRLNWFIRPRTSGAVPMQPLFGFYTVFRPIPLQFHQALLAENR
jgi:hypothetical protein